MTRHKRRITKLEDALCGCLVQLEKIRYCIWPTEGLGIGLQAHELDEVMIEADRLMPARLCK